MGSPVARLDVENFAEQLRIGNGQNLCHHRWSGIRLKLLGETLSSRCELFEMCGSQSVARRDT
jgi:hypothetical protein